MELSARIAGTHERCPYCHDLLEDQVLVQVQCPGCGTQHHQVCIQELGRCSVYGCEERLDVEPASTDTVPVELDSRLRRVVRQRLRERARAFVRQRATRPPDPRARLVAALAEARRAHAAREWRAAREAYEEIESLEDSCPDALEGVKGRIRARTAGLLAKSMRRQEEGRYVLRLFLIVASVLAFLAALVKLLSLGPVR